MTWFNNYEILISFDLSTTVPFGMFTVKIPFLCAAEIFSTSESVIVKGGAIRNAECENKKKS